MATLSIRNIQKSYGALKVLHGIDVDLDDGGFLVLLGPSGCGKSTLLNIIAGLDEPSNGDISIGERSVTALPPKDRNIAMVFQSYALYPTMSVARNIGFGLEMRGVSEQERRAEVQKAAEMLQINHLLDRLPANLSGGQRQRVAMGVRSCAARICFFSTNRSPTLMRNCAWRCGPKSSGFTNGSAPPSSM